MGKVKVFGKGFLGSAGDYNGSKFGNRCQTGMTLRDYFAAKAMQGFASKLGEPDYEHEEMAAYKYADAMIAEREKQKQEGM